MTNCGNKFFTLFPFALGDFTGRVDFKIDKENTGNCHIVDNYDKTKGQFKQKALDDNFLTPTKFSQEIERLVKKSNGLISYIEAVVTYCQENEIELETVPKLVSKPLKERLKHEAQRLNYMKASSKGVLPL